MSNFIRNPKIFANFTTFYVHVDGNDSNSGNDWSNAFATIGQALTALSTNPGTIQLGAGTFNAPSTGIKLGATQSIQGIGPGLASIINGSAVTTSGYAVVWIQGGRSGARDLWLTNVSGSGVIGLRVTDPSNGAGGGSTSTENVRIDNILVSVTNNATAFGIGDNTAYDVSEVMLTGCCSTGDSSTTTHMKLGNGTVGNVSDICNFGGNSQSHQNGIILQGSGLYSDGLNFQYSAVADITLEQVAIAETVIRGGRSENATRFAVIKSDYVGYNITKIADYVVVALHNTDGQGIQVQAPIIIENVVLEGNYAPQYIGMGNQRFETDGVNVSPVEVNSLTSYHLYPIGGSPYNRPGKLFRPRNLRFANDASTEIQSKFGTGQWIGLRRGNITSTSTTFTIYPDFYDVLELFLTANASTITLNPGSFVGQRLKITFIEDGIGGWTYSWPAACVFSGGSAPSNVTTATNRQSIEFMWNGSLWEQSGAVFDTIPPAAASNPVTEDFSNPSGAPQFYLTQPYHSGVASGSNPWISVPGGGSMGISGGVGVVTSLGLLGDDGTTPPGYNGLSGAFCALGSPGGGTGYVIETGLTTTTTGISVTFVYQNSCGVIFNYLNDQTFLMTGPAGDRFYVFGFNGTVSTEFVANLISPLTPGTTHTVLVDIGVSNTVFKLDGVTQATIPSSSLVAWANYTKHGFFATLLTETFSTFSVA